MRNKINTNTTAQEEIRKCLEGIFLNTGCVHAHKLPAIGKRTVLDLFNGCRQGDDLQGAAALKAVAGDGRDRAGGCKAELAERGAAKESAFGQGRNTGRDINALERSAIGKRALTDLG